MNNKGFTLIEVLCVIFLISIFFFGSFMVINNTFSITNEKAYEIVKEDIITQTKTYINECDNNIIKFHYNREIAMYAYLLKLYVENKHDIINPKIKLNVKFAVLILKAHMVF